MKDALKWTAAVFAEHVVLQVIATPAFAYMGSLLLIWWKGEKAMFDAIPPLFWPILACFVILVTFYPGFVVPFLKWRRERENRKKERENAWQNKFRENLEAAYLHVSHAYKPQIKNPKHPGNPSAIKEFAQNHSDIVRVILTERCRRRDIPSAIDVEDAESLREWYDFLRWERARHYA